MEQRHAKLLGVRVDADLDTVRKAVKLAAARGAHPDKVDQSDEKAVAAATEATPLRRRSCRLPKNSKRKKSSQNPRSRAPKGARRRRGQSASRVRASPRLSRRKGSSRRRSSDSFRDPLLFLQFEFLSRAPPAEEAAAGNSAARRPPPSRRGIWWWASPSSRTGCGSSTAAPR